MGEGEAKAVGEGGEAAGEVEGGVSVVRGGEVGEGGVDGVLQQRRRGGGG